MGCVWEATRGANDVQGGVGKRLWRREAHCLCARGEPDALGAMRAVSGR
jgi:hypothetical protein